VSEGDPDARERLQARIGYMDAVRLYFFPHTPNAEAKLSATAS
jgi:hypothetical protein